MKTIYALIDNDQICFIGKTNTSKLSEKLNDHILEAKSNPEKFTWITNMFMQGRKPELIPIFTYANKDEEYYEKLFISHFKFFLGLRLTKNTFKFLNNN